MKLLFYLCLLFLFSCLQNGSESETSVKAPLPEDEPRLESISFPKESNFNMTKSLNVFIDTKDHIYIKILQVNEAGESSQIAKVNLKFPTRFNFQVLNGTNSLILEVNNNGKVKQYRQDVITNNLNFYF